MKLLLWAALFAIVLTSAVGCKKCKTCVPYSYGALDTHYQTVTVCDKADINAYETGKDFIYLNTNLGVLDTVTYICN